MTDLRVLIIDVYYDDNVDDIDIDDDDDDVVVVVANLYLS